MWSQITQNLLIEPPKFQHDKLLLYTHAIYRMTGKAICGALLELCSATHRYNTCRNFTTLALKELKKLKKKNASENNAFIVSENNNLQYIKFGQSTIQYLLKRQFYNIMH